jgi:NADP-dependent 3-hydroxy acid dehydrogenase YdfG
MEDTFMINNTQTPEKPLAVIASNLCADGHDIAKQFAQNGYDLIVSAINPSVVEEAEDFKELGVDAVSFQLDLSTSEGVEQLYRRIVATGRPVEAIVMNAGTNSELAKKVLKDMALRGQGQILFDGNDDFFDIEKEAEGTGVTVSTVKPGQLLH